MENSPTISPASFTPDKTGYKKYLKAIGIVYNSNEFNPFVPTFLQFKTQSIDRISELEKQLEEVNESWYNHLKNGQDDNDIHTDAYHCKMNAKRLVYKLEELTA